MDHKEGSAAQLIQLEPLIHQVSGHSSLWVLDDVTVCKPLIGREAKFYRTLPPQMRAFTPEFRGTVKVVVQRTAEGVALAALDPAGGPAPTTHHALLHNNSGTCVSEREEKAAVGGGGAPPSAPPPAHNPWLEQCHQRYLTKLKQNVETKTNIIECILLENLTHVYRVPNVLDLKMGTRQYGDDAPESKRRSQTRKAQHTTTPRLGVRLAGMQVFNRDTKCYVCKNKYVGRELTEDGFQQTLRHFLHNGRRFRTDIVEQIICKLTDLRKVVATLDSFRFFTSSLLILYDSCDAKGSIKPNKDKSVDKDKNTDEQNRNRSRERHHDESTQREHKYGKLVNESIQRDCRAADSGACVPDRQGAGATINTSTSNECFKGIGSLPPPPPCDCETCIVYNKKHLNHNQHRCRVRNSSSTTDHRSDPCSTRANEQQQQHRNNASMQHEPLLQQQQQQQHNPTSQHQQKSPLQQQQSLQQMECSKHCLVSNSDVSLVNCNQKTGSSVGGDLSNKASPAAANPITNAVENNKDNTRACSPTTAGATSTLSPRTKVDIRLIDFAHATHKGMGDPTIYSGPDEGMMLGLKSLINIFTDIKEVYTK